MLRYLEPEALLHSRSIPEGVFLPYLFALVSPLLTEVYIQEFLSAVLFRSVFLFVAVSAILTYSTAGSLIIVSLSCHYRLACFYHNIPFLSSRSAQCICKQIDSRREILWSGTLFQVFSECRAGYYVQPWRRARYIQYPDAKIQKIFHIQYFL